MKEKLNFPEEFPEVLTEKELKEHLTDEEIKEIQIKWRDIKLSNDFLFSQVYQDKTAIKGLLKLVLNIKATKGHL